MQKASVFDVHTLSTHDGPGIRTVFFFKGCTLKCSWCQNPESIEIKNQVWHYSPKCLGCHKCVEACPQNAISPDKEKGIVIDYSICDGCGIAVDVCPGKALKRIGEPYTLEKAMEIVHRDKPFLQKAVGGGITVSGGEPLIQADFVSELFKGCKELDLHTAVDTCGAVSWSSFEKVFPYTDMYLYDVKLIDSKKHRCHTGAENGFILNNLTTLAEKIRRERPGTEIWIRTPIIPDATFSEENIAGIAEFLGNNVSDVVSRWELCSFNPLPDEKYKRLGLKWKYSGTPLLSREEGEKVLSWGKNNYPFPEKVIFTGMTSKE